MFFDVKTFRKYIVTLCRLFADMYDTYTIDISEGVRRTALRALRPKSPHSEG